MPLYPENPNRNQRNQTDTNNITIDKAFPVHFVVSAVNAVAAAVAGVLAATNATGEALEITENLTNPAVPRNITATAGGTAGDIAAIQVTVEGTNYKDEVISEVLPAFTVDTAGTVQGSKAFKTVTSVDIPDHDGVGATTSIGWGDKLGLPDLLPHNTVLSAFLNNTKEGTAPTVTTSTDNIESNTIDLNSVLNGSIVDVYYLS